MSQNLGFKIKNWLQLAGQSTLELLGLLDENGQVAYDTDKDKLVVRTNSVNDPVVQEARTATLTNKTIDADVNTISNIENADIKALAAIDASKLADGSVSNTEFQYLSNVSGDIQTQLNNKADVNLDEYHVYIGNSSDLAQEVDSNTLGDIAASVSGGLEIKSEVIVDGDISSLAAIQRSKLAAGSFNHVIINNGSGVLSSEAQLALSRGGSAIDNSQTDDNTTTGSSAQLNAVTGHVRLTNASLDSLAMIPAPSAGGISFTLYNDTGDSVTVLNNSGGTAANRIITGSGSDIALADGASLLLVYDGTEQRWLVVGGTGSGGSWVSYATESVANGGEVSSTMLAGFQLRSVQGSGGAVTLSNTPFGTSVLWNDGTVIRLQGASNDNTVTVVNADVAGGAILNGDCTLAAYSMLELQYNLNLDRWIESNRSE